MSSTEQMLKQILEEQKRLGIMMGRQEKRIEAIEQKLETQPAVKDNAPAELLPPALLRLLKAVSDIKTWVDADELSKKANLSRNLTSGYLARLKEKGYIERTPNMDQSRSSRFLFKANLDKVPEDVKRLIIRG